MPNNKLNHNKTLSYLNAEVKYAKDERRWSRYGRNGEASCGGSVRFARKAYNKAARRASKQQLNRYQQPREEYEPLYDWPETEDFRDDMDWTIGRDEQLFNAEVRGAEEHLFREAIKRMQQAV